jgi:hypothetical protein
MSPLKLSALLTATALVGIAAGLTPLAIGATQHTTIGDLSNNEGILVDVKTFKIVKGKAKSDPQPQIVKLGARPVTEGAIVFRSGDKLYIADGNPVGGPQAMNPGDPMPSTISGFNSLFENF